MRDKHRIPEVLKELEETWKLYPDMRLGQLIINALSSVTFSAATRPRDMSDLWHIEEDRLTEGLRALRNQFKGPNQEPDDDITGEPV